MAKRKYSIPYNGSNPLLFVNETVKRKDYIDHVFCELPYKEMVSHTRFQFQSHSSYNMNLNRSQYVVNCIDFLKLSKGVFRRICPINAMYYNFKDEHEFFDFGIQICKAVEEFSVDGLILTDYRLARFLHQVKPNLELHTSCNAYQWNIKQMDIWREKCGIKIFNPPREILRFPSKLKEMHQEGFKLKCIINEGCLVGCPNTFNHQMSISLASYSGSNCIQNGIGDIFKCNWILPRWQKYYDKYVDIYKIAGRNTLGNYPFFALDAYIKERDDLVLSDLMISGCITRIHRMLPADVLNKITLKIVPDKLLNCECKGCRKCGMCDKILSKVIPVKFYPLFENHQQEILLK